MSFARFLPLSLVVLLACSSESTSPPAGSEYNPLYEVAPSASVDSANVIGIWENTQTQSAQGVTVTSQQRIEIRDTTVKLANRCSGEGYETATVGVTINVTIADGVITTQDKGGTSTKQMSGPVAVACQVQLQGPGQLQYALGADKLQIAGGSFTKISD